jgi:hypothetical protein
VINVSKLWIVAQVESWTVWTIAWIHRLVQREKRIIIMDDNYIGNGSNNANGFQIDIYFFGHM